jgi:hypothetical protein
MYIVDPLDLSQFRVQQGDQSLFAKPRRRRQYKVRCWFLKGPIPGDWLHRAAILPGRALHVALALWYLAGLEKRQNVRITARVLDRFGVSRYAGRRGLAALEYAGLVNVKRHKGRCPIVTLLGGRA